MNFPYQSRNYREFPTPHANDQDFHQLLAMNAGIIGANMWLASGGIRASSGTGGSVWGGSPTWQSHGVWNELGKTTVQVT